MAILLVQSVGGLQGSLSGGSPTSTAFTSNVHAGNLLIAHFADFYGVNGSPNVYSILDTLGNVWIPVFNGHSTYGGSQVVWYAFANATGATTVQVTGGHAFPYWNGLELAEFSGVASLDQFAASIYNFDADPSLANPITTTSANELILSFGLITGGGGSFPSGGGAMTPALLCQMGYTGNATCAQMGYDIVSSIQTGFVSSMASPGGNDGSVGTASFIASAAPTTYSISGNAGVAGATVACTGQTPTTSAGDGSYSFAGLSNGAYTITPSKAGYVFASASSPYGPTQDETVSGANITGVSFVATLTPTPPTPSSVYGVPDCREAPFGPNQSRTVQGTVIYDVQTSSNSAVPTPDPRKVVPVDSRQAASIPQNSRTPGTNGPGN